MTEWLTWQLKWGGEKTDFLSQVAQRGEMPAALANRPSVGLEWRPFIDAYVSLNAGRQIGFGGPQPISLESLAAYYRMLPMADWEEYLEILQAMDAAFITHFAEQSKSKTSQKPPPPPKPQARR